MNRRLRPIVRRRRDPVRPACEALEGRALLATTPFDPNFGTGGVVVLNTPQSTTSASVRAVAVQGDGRIVTAQTNSNGTQGGAQPSLLVSRFNADGSVDKTFGTDGQAVIPFGASGDGGGGTSNIAITASGQIVVVAEASSSSTSADQDVVVQLTGAGALDTTFGTGGEYALPGTISGADSVVVQASGRVVVAGASRSDVGDPPTRQYQAVLLGLTPAGAPDSTFGTAGQVPIPAPEAFQHYLGLDVIGLRATPAGQLLLGLNYSSNLIPLPIYGETLTRLSAAGAIDTTFGTGGTVSIPSSDQGLLYGDFVVGPQGSIVLAGSQITVPGPFGGSNAVIDRLTADGAADPTFTPVSVTLPDNNFGSFGAVALGADGTITALGGTSLYRFTSTGALDTSFGTQGRVDITLPATTLNGGVQSGTQSSQALALTSARTILVGGGFATSTGASASAATKGYLAQILPVAPTPPPTPKRVVPNDYDGDGRSDLAAELATFGAFAYRTARGDTVQPFGPGGADGAIPAPGDYDGDGRTDVAAYLPAFGVLAYRPSSGGADVLVRFGPAGVGNAIPAPGDYDGDGKTDVALYLPGSGTFVVDPSGGGAPYAVAFGPAGAGASIPAPGDYDGDGKTDLALYLPAAGAFAIDPSSGSARYAVSFGAIGAGNTIPAPGDYDGDGRTDIAAYLPQYGVYAVRTSSNKGDVLTTFGPAGTGNALPVPGDYDGDGRTDIALYLPGPGAYAIDPSGGRAPYAVPFGQPGAGNTIPATAVVMGQDTAVSAASLAGTPTAAADVPVYMPDDLPTPTGRKKAHA